MTAQARPHVGQLVMYVEDDGQHHNPAVITAVNEDNTINVVFFQTHDMSEPAQARRSVPHVPPGDTSHPHSWHEITHR